MVKNDQKLILFDDHLYWFTPKRANACGSCGKEKIRVDRQCSNTHISETVDRERSVKLFNHHYTIIIRGGHSGHVSRSGRRLRRDSAVGSEGTMTCDCDLFFAINMNMTWLSSSRHFCMEKVWAPTLCRIKVYLKTMLLLQDNFFTFRPFYFFIFLHISCTPHMLFFEIIIHSGPYFLLHSQINFQLRI